MIKIDGNHLSISDVYSIAAENETVSISAKAINNIEHSFRLLNMRIQSSEYFYGINTGFGVFQSKLISQDQIQTLNRNLIISHAIGAGEYLPTKEVRAAMIVRANTLAKGYSGIRLEIIQTLIDMLNNHVTPQIKSQGSLGSSGDLCLLAQLALVLSRDPENPEHDSGKAIHNDQIVTGYEAMKRAGISRIVLGPKEGLAIINGATFSASTACLLISQARYLTYLADACAACTLEALLGRSEPFDERMHEVRKQAGQMESAALINSLIKNSNLINSSTQIQDAYSLRCTPQVHGAVRDAVKHAEKIITNEINAATDNPLIFMNGDIISGGNFHGEPIALVMDYFSMGMAELGAISERRIARLLDSNHNVGLPPMLVDNENNAGLQSGLMIPHYVAASMALESQRLASPDSVRSIPTSANQEDFNANSWNAVRKAVKITENSMRILTIELYIAAHALDLRLKKPKSKMGTGTKKIFETIRTIVPLRSNDVLWDREIETLFEEVKQNRILSLTK